jgi:hypothetical protein
MSVFRTATFGDIKFGKFFTARDIEDIQNLAKRQNYMAYDENLVDFNVLTPILPREFFLMPYFEYTLTAVDRLDNLAYKFYGDPDYWWCIASFNRIIDPFDISDIEMITVPHKSELFHMLIQLRFER